MLLEPISVENRLDKLKLKYFSFQKCIVNSMDDSGSLLEFILKILSFVPTVCLLFKENKLTFQQIDKFFRSFILSQCWINLGVNQLLIIVLITIFNFMFLLLLIYNYKYQIANSFSYKFFALLITLTIYFIVPITQFHIYIILNNSKFFYFILFKIFAAFSIIFYLLFLSLFLKFKIKPLRKSNHNWNFNNHYQFYQFILNSFRTFVFTFDGLSFAAVFISIVVQLFIRFFIYHYHNKKHIIQLQTYSNLILSVHTTSLIYSFTNQDSYSTKFLLASLFFLILKGIYEFLSQQKKSLQFPLCDSSPFELYNFYYNFQEKLQLNTASKFQTNQNLYYCIFKQHQRKCDAKGCPLKRVCLMKNCILSQSEDLISQILIKFKFESPSYQILQQIWKFQRGRKFSFRNLKDKINIEKQYAIFTIGQIEASLMKIDNINAKLQLNAIFASNIFYDELSKILQNFSQLYLQILKSKPRIESITEIGQCIRIKVEQIQDLYMNLLKKKSITFRAIQLYIQFQTFFLKSDSLNHDLTKKIIAIQKNIIIDQIQQIYMPALNVYSETGVIENANMQCISFLKLTRFEIKTKNIQNFFLPNFKAEKYFSFTQQEKQSSLIFIIKNNHQYSCGNIKINIKFINGKKFYIYIFQKKHKSQDLNFILIDKNFQIVKLISSEQILKQKRHPQIMIKIIWKQIFQKYIKPYQKQIKITKLMKIDLKQYDSILMCSLNKTYADQYSILSIKFIRNIKDSINQRRSVVMRSNVNVSNLNKLRKFQFQYDSSRQNQIFLKGYNKYQSLKQKNSLFQNRTLQIFTNKIQSNLVNTAIIKPNNWKHGIKTYRLVQNDLYNVDLQDKQAYYQLFKGKNKQLNGKNREGSRPLDVYIIALVISVSLALAGLSIVLLYSMDQDMTRIKKEFINSNQIDRFKMNFYRILAMYRDVASGLYQQLNRDWISDVLNSYNILRANKNQKMFSNDKMRMLYAGYQYQGNLNELIQVILSDVFMLTKQFEAQRIQEIHDTSILQLTGYIQSQQDQISKSIVSNITNLREFKKWILLGSAIGVVLFYILMICLCFNLVSSLKYNLSQLMLISDNQARTCQQNADKLIYGIQMAKKNFQIDLKHFLFLRKKFKPRKRQKQAIIGYNLKVLTFCIVLVLLLVNLLVIGFFYFTIQSNFDHFNLMKNQGQDIIGTYSNVCQYTNIFQHTGNLNLSKVTLLKQQLLRVEKSRLQLSFSDQTNRAIINYFFQNSCQRISSHQYFPSSAHISCEIATPNYEVQNPFVMGLDFYLNRVHYNIVQNLSDTFSATGAYSFSFAKIFSEISNSISDDCEQKLNGFIINSGIWSIILIIINVMYCLSAILLSLYVKRKVQSVQKLIKFLDLNKKYQPNNKKNSEKSNKSLTQKNQVTRRRLSALEGPTE